jgi:hypothetical protein
VKSLLQLRVSTVRALLQCRSSISWWRREGRAKRASEGGDDRGAAHAIKRDAVGTCDGGKSTRGKQIREETNMSRQKGAGEKKDV